MIIPNSFNEWDTLREVIVGSVEGAQIPTVKDKSLHCIDYAHLSDEEFQNIPTGRYPQRVLDETYEDLEQICSTLKYLGVRVHRPKPVDFTQKRGNGKWEVDGYYNYCPRDSMLVIGDKVIATPMTLRHRQFEADSCKHLIHPNHWVDFPKPNLGDEMYSREDLGRPTLMDGPEPVFDAANILRANNDVIYLVSNTGNLAGADYLERYLWDNISTDYKVHRVQNVYAYIHIDTTFVLLREGLVLLNPERVNESNIPEIFRGWDRIWAPEPYPTQVMNEWCPASPWLGMNILPINEKLVMIEEHQIMLMKELKRFGIESIPVRMRHARTLSGGPHCITTDLVRGNRYII
jgi:glycine amidinotransferase/scyllo-inosamine-4-phosphate amidinotransferase 1